MKKFLWLSFSLAAIFLLSNSCRRNRLQVAPPQIRDKKANITILDFKKKLYKKSNTFVKVEEDFTIGGVVVANDKEGNFYKQIVIQDASGGIAILIDGRSLFSTYPIGRKVFVRTKGLVLNDYASNIQLGSSVDANARFPRLVGIPSNLANTYIERGTFNNLVAPMEVDIDSLTTGLHDRYQNTLIVIKKVQAKLEDKGRSLGDVSKNEYALSYALQNCKGATISLRTSSYAYFAKELVPKGNGTLAGIFTPYHTSRNDVKQIAIRNMDDIDMESTICQVTPREDKKNPETKNKKSKRSSRRK